MDYSDFNKWVDNPNELTAEHEDLVVCRKVVVQLRQALGYTRSMVGFAMTHWKQKNSERVLECLRKAWIGIETALRGESIVQGGDIHKVAEVEPLYVECPICEGEGEVWELDEEGLEQSKMCPSCHHTCFVLATEEQIEAACGEITKRKMAEFFEKHGRV
jgi:hypothetical protein